MERNADGNQIIEATMQEVRDFSGWYDELETDNSETVTVCEDGSVNIASNGDLICESIWEDANPEWLAEWRKFWGF
jgi:hypothetical protein